MPVGRQAVDLLLDRKGIGDIKGACEPGKHIATRRERPSLHEATPIHAVSPEARRNRHAVRFAHQSYGSGRADHKHRGALVMAPGPNVATCSITKRKIPGNTVKRRPATRERGT